ncbi:MAG: nucleoside:proton symporter [Rhodospirillaceae bacterium]|nr:nucleoside:proton symporter [Rhodospirillaceae bacterium]
MTLTLQAILGLGVTLAVSALLSRRRRQIPWKSVAVAVGSQIGLGLLFLHVEWARQFLGLVTSVAAALSHSTMQATAFVFGYIGGGDLPFDTLPGSSSFVFALQVLPLIIVFGAFSAVLVHWRVLGFVVSLGAWVVRKTMGVSGPVGFAAVANAFLGMIEAPLLIKPYLSKLAPNELFVVMAVGMSTVAGGTAVIISAIVSSDPQIFANVITATLMNVPGAIAIALILFPPDAVTPGEVTIRSPYRSTMDALVTGTADGVKIFLNVVSLLIVFIALISLIDLGLGNVFDGLTLSRILGTMLAPIAWLLGIDSGEIVAAGGILGTKLAVNEIVAYTDLAGAYGTLTPHTHFVLTFALCGFGNFGSLAIMIGGISAMAPERRQDVIRFGFWALLAALLTNCMTAAIASILG